MCTFTAPRFRSRHMTGYYYYLEQYMIVIGILIVNEIVIVIVNVIVIMITILNIIINMIVNHSAWENVLSRFKLPSRVCHRFFIQGVPSTHYA